MLVHIIVIVPFSGSANGGLNIWFSVRNAICWRSFSHRILRLKIFLLPALNPACRSGTSVCSIYFHEIGKDS